MRRQLTLMAYNRPQYFRPVTEHWCAARGFDDWTPLVSLDPGSRIDQMVDIADDAALASIVNPHIYGVGHHPWAVMERAFATAGADFAVIAEDDVLVSSDILEYFTWAAEYFADEHILTVCAATYAPGAAGQEYDVISRRHFAPMCWGTWADRWTSVLRDTWDHNYSTGTPPEAGWDYNINLRIMADWQVVAPVWSRTDHIGADEGVHTTPYNYPTSRGPGFTPHRPPGTYQHVLDR